MKEKLEKYIKPYYELTDFFSSVSILIVLAFSMLYNELISSYSSLF
jgi:hypothetical protein